MDDYLAANRALWDEWTAIHQTSSFYDLEGFKRGGSRLRDYEVDEVGDVGGKSLLHLQCHFGIDTLSWARLGARVTGVDFSPVAIARARDLARRAGLDVRFVLADMLALPGELHGVFDLAVATYGVLCWIGDLDRWARSAASTLRPGGRLVLVDLHPLFLMVDSVDPLVLGFPYADTGPLHFDVAGSYADPHADIGATATVQWAHSLGEVVGAVAGAGLWVDSLVEHLSAEVDHRGGLLVQGADGRWHLPVGGQDLPVLFALGASKPAG
jgi:SAM-dependent methyltransferase